MTTKINKVDIGFKAGAFADGVGVLCGDDLERVQRVFRSDGDLVTKNFN